MLALTLLAVLSPDEVRLSVQAGVPCELAEPLSAALAHEQVEVTEVAAALASVAAADGGLLLTLLDASGSVRGQRRVPVVAGDCAALPRSLALLVRAWLDAPLPPVTHSAPRRARALPSPPAPVPPPTPEPLEPRAEEQTSPLPTREAPMPEPPVVAAAVAVSAPAAAPPAPVRPARTFSLQTCAGLGVDDDTVAQFAASASLGFSEPWAISLDAGFESARRRATALNAEVSWGGFSLRRAFYFFDSLTGLYVSLGLRAVRIHASTSTARAEVMTGALAGQAEWRQVLVGGLFVSAGAAVQARPRPERITDASSGTQLVVPPWSVGFSAGAGWIFP